MEIMSNAAGFARVLLEEEQQERKKNSEAGFAGLAELQPTSTPSDAYLNGYLMMNWCKFRKIGRMIMKNGCYIPQVWKAYVEYKKQSKFSDRILLIIKLTHLKR